MKKGLLESLQAITALPRYIGYVLTIPVAALCLFQIVKTIFIVIFNKQIHSFTLKVKEYFFFTF